VAWLSGHGPIDDPRQPGHPLDATAVEQWRGAAHYHTLASAWATGTSGSAESIAALLQRWRRREAKLRRDPDLGQRRHATAARDDIYRRFAAALAAQAKILVLDDVRLAELNRTSNARLPAARKLIASARRVVAPGRLRSIIAATAVREGCTINDVGHVGLSRIHGDGCGYENPSDARYQSALVRCDGCGQSYDQDHAATALMLQRARR
jgi:hypothetical protein